MDDASPSSLTLAALFVFKSNLPKSPRSLNQIACFRIYQEKILQSSVVFIGQIVLTSTLEGRQLDKSWQSAARFEFGSKDHIKVSS